MQTGWKEGADLFGLWGLILLGSRQAGQVRFQLLFGGAQLRLDFLVLAAAPALGPR